MTESAKQRYTRACKQAQDGLFIEFLASGGSLESTAKNNIKSIISQAIIDNLEPADVMDMAVEHLFFAIRLGEKSAAQQPT